VVTIELQITVLKKATNNAWKDLELAETDKRKEEVLRGFSNYSQVLFKLQQREIRGGACVSVYGTSSLELTESVYC
jgi:hypothetical protein